MLHLTAALDPSSSTPLYQQLYQTIVHEIQQGTLPAGTRMPGKRSLAAALSVSVNTVDTAYQLLTAEGHLESRERSGFYVQETISLPLRSSHPLSVPAAVIPPAPTHPPIRFDLSTGGIDTSLFPFRTWGRLQKELLYSAPELLAHGDPQGDENLRQALANYLEEYRGVQCTSEQIVVGAGLEYLLGLVAPLLPSPAAVENPGYPRARQIFQNNGIPCRSIPVDEGGLSVHALSLSDAALCYVTPSHQFPTGVTMPAPRRAALLYWASQKAGQRYIIEDDYDSEFRFDTRPLPSLQGMAGADGPVIYLSTCSRSLAPSIRIAYMVLPQHLLPRWKARYAHYANTVSRFEQQTLARFITEGYFTRLLARERVAYKARRTALVNALTSTFSPQQISLSGLHTGLHLLLTVKDCPHDRLLAQSAAEEGIRLSPLSAYFLDDTIPQSLCPPGTLVLGYGALSDSLCLSLSRSLKKACMTASLLSSGTIPPASSDQLPNRDDPSTDALLFAKNSNVSSS